MKKRPSLFLGAAAIVAVSFGAPAAQSAGAQLNVVDPVTDPHCGELGNPCPPPQNPVSFCIRYLLRSPVEFVACVRAWTPPHQGHLGE